MTSDEHGPYQAAMNILFCGGIAGVVTWGSVFPLDMIKTRLQTQTITDHSRAESQSLVRPRQTLNSFQIARETYRVEGIKAFYRGLGVCSVRAFVVNAVQVRHH
jgi:solute carrier family 25 carnitine/acylcarnitine transporter 20/29